LRQQSSSLASKAEAMDVEVSLGALEAFYTKYDPTKLVSFYVVTVVVAVLTPVH